MPKKTLPRIAAVSAGRKSLTLNISWNSGEESRVDVSGLIETFQVYEPLRRSPELFRQVRVGEYGTDVVWTDEIDMAAETLWRLAQEQSGATMSPDAFRHWRERKAYRSTRARARRQSPYGRLLRAGLETDSARRRACRARPRARLT
jgi:hypothetical protein